ncbi:hypothetical protein HG535_0G03680 [Zygotorulaspora mrakii]|uniref:Nuclear mRNA export factor n=1 Tax=Zygotorulaspora mrakii TaxID=42260 RepID=A0A7H9B6Y4_ZYGMR|nr:uncharacterized protein HG535_0G03680 [Zygotorulaspora mrakii]QLG74485.1 hypothetical protein HG535_0G03680 [Zygotorulaspora mrakii]
MNISFGTTIPSSPFNFFGGNNDHGGFSSINSGTTDVSSKAKRTGLPHFGNRDSASQKQSKKKPSNKPITHEPERTIKHKPMSNKYMKLRIPQSSDADIGALISEPERLGFSHVEHKLRPMPRFLIGQQAQLKQKKFQPDSWDRANQDKMLKLENSIEDVTDLYETLKKMRDVERKIMENKGLVDKADSAKDLTEAISFQGTCLDMCPIFERARRNVEYTVYSYEKDDPSGKKASRSKALKVFARPAAAAAPPLPSDVRPPHILSLTLDYIIDNLLVTLPDSEGFIWDRMRSIRQDFTYQNYSGPEAIECNEKIVRIHLLIIHVMGKSKNEFSLQQELEQLHKSLITLSEIYDEVRANGGNCPNEAEFRAYALLSKIRDPEYDKNIQELPIHIFQNDLVQLALCFRRYVSNSSFHKRGFIRTENCLNFYNAFFQVLNSGRVPFLMGSFLELYVNEVRFYAFKALSLSINKRHKPIPCDHLIETFLFNSKEELEDFCKYYSIDITDEGVELKTLTHHSHKLNESQPLKQASLKCVDDLLLGTSFPELINSGKPTVYTIPNNNIGSTNHAGHQIDEMEQEEDGNEEEEQEEEVEVGEANRERETGLENEANTRKINYISTEQNNFVMPSLTKQGVATEKVLGTQQPQFDLSSSSPTIIPRRGFKNEFSSNNILPGAARTNNSNQGDINLLPDGNAKLAAKENIKERSLLEDGTKNRLQLVPKAVERKKAKNLEIEAETIQLKNQAARDISNEIIKKVVQDMMTTIANDAMQKKIIEKRNINKLTGELYYAFLHEKIYNIYLGSRAEVFRERKLKSRGFNKWKMCYKTRKEERDTENKRKAEFQNAGRQLGVPLLKKSKIFSTPCNNGASSFVLPHSLGKDITFSPVFDEANIFSKQTEKRLEVWEPMDTKSIYFEPLRDKCKSLKHQVTLSIFIYGTSWTSIPNNWAMSKFGKSDPSKETILQDEVLKLSIHCIDSTYNPASFANLQLLVFNTGVTDSNIFDLEMKLQQDGEELIKLATGISLNTNVNFSILILYWESTETPLSDATIFRCLKLNRISKSFCGILEDINIVAISGNSPHAELERVLKQVANRFRYKLTERGKYHASLRQTNSTVKSRHQPRTTQAIDEKMRHMLESEQRKYKEEEDQRNTYAHLKSHIDASPKNEKKKLPVLLSKRKDYKFKTPLAIRSLSSSSPAIPSHLATKMRRAPRVPSYHGVLAGGTPSHSTNLPVVPISTGCMLNSATDYSQISNSSFEHPTVIHEPDLYQTPLNSNTNVTSRPSNISEAAQDDSISEDVLELKDLIESVKRKVHNK